MRECEEKLKNVHLAKPRDWISRLARGWQVTKGGIRVKLAGELKSHVSWNTKDKTSNLAMQLAHDSV